MRGLLIGLLITIGLSAVAQTRTYTVYSYRLTVINGVTIDSVADTLEIVPRPLQVADHLYINYHDGHYWFKVETIHEEYPLGELNVLSGLMTFNDNPYSIRMQQHHDKTTIWIIPLLFHINSSINNLRAFCFTDDPQIITELQKL